MNSERRAQPRYVVNFPVYIEVEGADQVFDGQALNASRNALEVDCDIAAVQSLQAQGNYPSLCEVTFRLPGMGQDTRLECQMIRYRRLSQHRFRLVLGFRESLAMSAATLSSRA